MATQPMNIEHVQSYALGGRAVLIFANTGTSNVRRFIVSKKKNTEGIWYVRTVLNNVYVGHIRIVDSKPVFVMVPNPETTDIEHQAKSFAYMWERINGTKPLSPVIKIYHQGTCSVCGRPLQDAESVKLGLGPTCLKRIQSL